MRLIRASLTAWRDRDDIPCIGRFSALQNQPRETHFGCQVCRDERTRRRDDKIKFSLAFGFEAGFVLPNDPFCRLPDYMTVLVQDETDRPRCFNSICASIGYRQFHESLLADDFEWQDFHSKRLRHCYARSEN